MYPVDLHMHTVASTHAYSTLSDYIAQAKQKGIKLFAPGRLKCLCYGTTSISWAA